MNCYICLCDGKPNFLIATPPFEMKSEVKESEVRAQIIEKAAQLFQIFGYKKLVMEDIARAIGKSRTSLYFYYKDKDAIFNAIIQREIKNYLDALAADLPRHDSATEKLKAYFEIKFDFRYAKTVEYPVMSKEYDMYPELLPRMRVISDPPEIAHLTAILKEGVANGEFIKLDQESIELTVKMLISSLHGIANDLLADVEHVNVKKVKQLLSEMFVKSLSPH